MARSAIKTPKRKKPRAAPTIRRGGKLPDYDWAGWETWSGAKYHHQRRVAFDFYYQNYKAADLTKFVFEWMKSDGGYKKPEIDAIKAIPTWKVNVNTCILAKCLLSGMPDVNEAWNEYWIALPGTSDKAPRPVSETLKARIDELLEEGKELLKEKKKEARKKEKAEALPKPTIQDRIKEQAVVAYEEIDDWLESFVQDPKSFKPDGFDFAAHFRKVKVTQAHARKMKAFFQGELEEFRVISQMPTPAKMKGIKDAKEKDEWDQIKEGYAHLKRAEVKNFLTALESLDGALDMIIEESKANRKSPTRKPKSADKVVAKMKYKVKDDKYQLVGVNPTQIIGASELWVFNTKTRKLGKYIAANPDPIGQAREGSGLSIKGTTVQGYVEDTSVQKTLRKPEEQLKEFKAAGKVKLRKFMDEIPTVDTKLNGRINAETILLKVA